VTGLHQSAKFGSGGKIRPPRFAGAGCSPSKSVKFWLDCRSAVGGGPRQAAPATSNPPTGVHRIYL